MACIDLLVDSIFRTWRWGVYFEKKGNEKQWEKNQWIGERERETKKKKEEEEERESKLLILIIISTKREREV